MSLRIRRGTDDQRSGIVLDQGEIVWTTDNQQLWVGDGVTQGGVSAAKKLAGIGLSFNETNGKIDYVGLNTTTDDLEEGNNNLYFKTDRAQAAVGAALIAGNDYNTGITFEYDDIEARIIATVSSSGGGLASVSDDPNPVLGGNLTLNGKNITGTGNINTTGTAIISGTFTTNTGLGANLSLNSHNITGAGNVNITGDVVLSGSITANTGLGANLSLNSHNITGTGNISTTGNVSVSGTISATTGLGANLSLNGYNVSGTGNISIAGGIITRAGASSIVNLSTYSPVTFLERGIEVNAITDGTHGAWADVNASKNTHAAPAAIAAGDVLGGLRINGFDGTNNVPSVIVAASVNSSATLTDPNPASTATVGVANGASFTFFEFTDTGAFVAPTTIMPGVHATVGARDSAILDPLPGMLVYVTSESKFYGYVDDDGSMSGTPPVPNWVALN